MIHYELLKPRQTLTGELYRVQLMSLNAEIHREKTEYATKHESIFFIDDSAQPHRAKPVQNYVETVGPEVLPHPLYSPDLAQSEYHLFRSMQNALTGVRFTLPDDVKNWLDSYLAAKTAQFFWEGIHKLPERWERVVLSDGHYFE